MTSSLFISYSRREAPFVDSLLDELEDRCFGVWLDYHDLVPARPWQDQIYQGIDEAEIFLLVVSKESLASKNVEVEWRRAIEQQKRIILIIFEAVKLPAELQVYEWVDLRISFKKGVAELLTYLKTPLKEVPTPPQQGFKSPPVVWRSFWLGVLVGLISIPTWWTIFIPYVLIPLPYRILKRNFNFFEVQSVVVMLPFALLLTAFFFSSNTDVLNVLLGCFFFSLLPVPILLFLLRSADMQRWGKPIASRPKFANPYDPHIKKPHPTPFTVDFAPEDQAYAADIIAGLKNYGHPYVAEAPQAEVCFVLISKHKNTTTFNPEKHAVYPIILQDSQVEDPKIRRVQWIDFRRGLKHLDKLAQLLPEPARMLKALGIVPMSNQTVLPPIIQVLVYYLTLLAIFTVSIWLPLMVELGPEFAETSSAGTITCLVIPLLGLILATIWFTRRALLRRAGRLASFRNFSLSILLLGFLIFIQLLIVEQGVMEASQLNLWAGYVSEEDTRGLVVLFGPLTYLLGLVIIGWLALWNWSDFRRWFLPKSKANHLPVRPSEKAV